MKKIIIKIASATLLVGGLAFNFVVGNENISNQDVNIATITRTSIALGEYSGASKRWDSDYRDCRYGALGSVCVGM